MPYSPESRLELNPSISEGNPKSNPERRKERGKFELQPTHIEGVSLKVDKGEEIDISKRDIRELLWAGKKFVDADVEEKGAKKERDEQKDRIVEVTERNEKLHGVVSEPEHWEITISPSVKKEWVEAVVKESLGILYYSYTREDYGASIYIPRGAKTATGVIIDKGKVKDAVWEALRGLGFSDEDIKMIMQEKTTVQLDEEALKKAIDEGRVSLPPEATKEKLTWSVSGKKI